jgi:hypothetical protein
MRIPRPSSRPDPNAYLPWNHREPLCEPPFAQVRTNRKGRSYRFSCGEVMRSLQAASWSRHPKPPRGSSADQQLTPVAQWRTNCGAEPRPSFGDDLGLRELGAAEGSDRRGTGLIRELAKFGSFAGFGGEPRMVHRASRFHPDPSGGTGGTGNSVVSSPPCGEAGPPVVPAQRRRLVHPGKVICQPAAPISRQLSRHHAETIDDIVKIVHADRLSRKRGRP